MPGQILKKRADWRDTNATGDQQGGRATSVHAGERTVRALNEHPGTGLDAEQPGAALAERLCRQPQRLPVRRRGQRERVALPPTIPGEESPQEELPGPRRQLVE